MAEVTTLYVVTEGEYSDYRVMGIFSTEEKAKEAATYWNCLNDIEQWQLDPEIPNTDGRYLYCVVMNKDGTLHCVQYGGNPSRENSSDLFRDSPYGSGDRNGPIAFYVMGRDEAHAIKVANERRIQLLAADAWDGDWQTWRKRCASTST